MNTIQLGMSNLAKVWEQKIYKFIPFYDEMIDNLISVIPFKSSDSFSAIDLGAGTGEITKRIKNKFHHARIDCIDLVKEMLETAKLNLAAYSDISFEICDFNNYRFTKKYDVIFSSLAIHHLEPKEQKALYKRIYEALNYNGIFINAENVLGASDFLNTISYQTYYNLVAKNVSAAELVNLKEALETHDKPMKLTDHVRCMEEIGFKDIDIIWRKTIVAVFCGRKL